MKYRKKPLVIEARKLTRMMANVIVDWVGRENIEHYNLGEFAEDTCYIEIKSLEGTVTASEGDWIIRGIVGEFYPCKPDVFDASYEAVTGDK